MKIKDRVDKARQIIDRNFLGEPFGEDDLEEFSDIVGEPIDGVKRMSNPQFPSDPRHLYVLSDGGWQPRSWVKMIKPLTPEQEVKRAMRFAVREDLADYMSSATPRQCARCASVDYLTVDHINPPFNKIANDFIKENGLPAIGKSEDPNVVVDMFTNIDQEAEWIRFHATHSVYQILCRSCNASKGAR